MGPPWRTSRCARSRIATPKRTPVCPRVLVPCERMLQGLTPYPHPPPTPGCLVRLRQAGVGQPSASRGAASSGKGGVGTATAPGSGSAGSGAGGTGVPGGALASPGAASMTSPKRHRPPMAPTHPSPTSAGAGASGSAVVVLGSANVGDASHRWEGGVGSSDRTPAASGAPTAFRRRGEAAAGVPTAAAAAPPAVPMPMPMPVALAADAGVDGGFMSGVDARSRTSSLAASTASKEDLDQFTSGGSTSRAGDAPPPPRSGSNSAAGIALPAAAPAMRRRSSRSSADGSTHGHGHSHGGHGRLSQDRRGSSDLQGFESPHSGSELAPTPLNSDSDEDLALGLL
jgi:hypothetical protein